MHVKQTLSLLKTFNTDLHFKSNQEQMKNIDKNNNSNF